MASERQFDIVVYGATGFTGRLVAEYLSRQYADGTVKWAMAGRSAKKLEEVRDLIGAPKTTPLIAADASDPAALKAMVESTKVVLTTVGPYQLYGAPLVAACAAAGTDYVDLCGEVPFMRQMIDAHQEAAQKSGARIVFSCGFDSIPFDLGVFFLQEQAKAKFGQPVPRVKGRVRAMNGTLSGGTAASGRATMEAAAKDKTIMGYLFDPYSLAPGTKGVAQPDGQTPHEDKTLGSWVAPFFMAVINTKNVHRSNFLLNNAYGADFAYDEMMLTGPGEKGKQTADFIANNDMMGGDDVPQPGEGPSKEEREAGNYDVLFVGEGPDGKTIKVGVTGDKDPGYGSTSKMIAESAICLANDVPDLKGGFWTTAPAFGMKLVERLRANAGLTFEVEG
ncbi:MAG: saccharopine dehydrogenase NADP-binding domain-containing protein [Alphaproteobacteria bacterium]|nr:saccharopine dehydrogenase NADP-binding domain-containing protein [Alphaproteobacteria bacterium]MBO6629779.1 saccharopine dehydrogenase NADP-binding domain-containing protein [Alphaproteobacteria bacterium]MDF1625033.1 saccharopine dehydrogenase NADP-binding domain-containing protein [Parvibaculaceae bacterium]